MSDLTKKDLIEIRNKHMSASQSLSYNNSGPLLILRGEKQFLYDENGNAYLDTRNNVPHVGHCHPKVAEAISKQVYTLNTNTRYLHPNICQLTQRLASTMPDPLQVCFIVNSGSEANDLALRLALAHTKKDGVVVVDRAYHGHTVAVLAISPYKYEGKGGDGAKSHVFKIPCPDTYRGKHRGEDAGKLYAKEVEDVVKAANGRVGCFIIESGMSVGGVVIPPDGYLQEVYKIIRANGGVCIADEVQVGFGRIGTHFWAFEQQGVVPDIVTVGKPFGNGMPLAAVVTTPEIAASFCNGMEYFNTFGGNPVCAAAGLAVLDIIEQEHLQQHAKEVGEYLKSKLVELSKKHTLIGDVRGSGLFVGVEFVRDRETKEPAKAETSAICTRMKEEHKILTSIDGLDNVFVFKPPMCFNKDNVDQLCTALDHCITTLGEINLNVGHTPT